MDIGRLEQLNNILPIGAKRSINPLETLLFHNRFVRESYTLEQSNRDMGRRRRVFFWLRRPGTQWNSVRKVAAFTLYLLEVVICSRKWIDKYLV